MAADKKFWLRDHLSATGRRDVRAHYERASDAVQAAFDAHWELLEGRPRERWTRPDAAKLDPEWKGGFREFFEFRFKADNVQQRPLGFFGPDDGRFALLLWAIEKGHKFAPKEAIDTCDKRRKSILDGQATTHHWDEDEKDESEQAGEAPPQNIPRRLR
ncbi:hypothetical protein [Burkholderia sp. BCC1993]|uniref:hypothetical protein n=1 Tax=Burkholderia sp. BCC1993 TaxID=2817444 RepID=UPI002AB16451|nr:hypothetical protein [Burkholderia sp. BCC1993]